MREGETELEMVKRHVKAGAECIAKQHAIIARLRRKDLQTDEAKILLAIFEDTQRQHEDHLMRIVEEQA